MKLKLLYIFIFTSILSCQKESKEETFNLQGSIDGLKKGTLYLQKIQDSVLVTVDSVKIKGDSNFNLTYDLQEPEVMYLRLNKNDNDDSALMFFADKGTTKITSTLKNFIYDAKIEGSEQQKLIEEYAKIQSRFNDLNLDLIKNSLENKGSQDSLSVTKIKQDFDNLLKRKYLYTINFAFNHKDSEVAPFLAVTEIPDANKKYLDTIYNGLNEDIQTSKYGKLLKELIAERNQ